MTTMTTQASGHSATQGQTEAPLVVIPKPIRTQGWSYEVEARLLGERGVRLIVPRDDAEAAAALPDADILFACDTVTAADIESMKHPAGILAYSVGMDYIDAKAAAARGIPIWNCPTHNSEEVSDHAVTLLLAANRRVLDFANAAAKGEWDVYEWPQMRVVHRMRGSTIGMVGIGRIGQKIARKLHGFGVRIIAYDPYIKVLPDPWAELASLDDVMTKSDFIIVAAALTDTSRGLLNDEVLGKIKRCYVLVNVSRGGIIVESALAEGPQGGPGPLCGARRPQPRAAGSQERPPDRPAERAAHPAHRGHVGGVPEGHSRRGGQPGPRPAGAGGPDPAAGLGFRSGSRRSRKEQFDATRAIPGDRPRATDRPAREGPRP